MTGTPREEDAATDRAVEQHAETDGSNNIVVQAAHDATVTVHQTPFPGAGEFGKYYLPPLLFAGLLAQILHDWWGLKAEIVAALVVVVWFAWSATRNRRLSWGRRIALPLVAGAYVVAMVALAALPHPSLLLQIAAPAALWVAAASAIMWLVAPSQRADAAFSYIGVATIGAGVAVAGSGANMLFKNQVLSGLSEVGGGVALVCLGIAVVLTNLVLFNVAAIGLGAVMIGGGVAAITSHHLLFGITGICCGIAAIAYGLAITADHALFGLAMIVLGVAGGVYGVAEIFSHQILTGVSVTLAGVATTSFGVREAINRPVSTSTFMLVFSVPVTVYGLSEVFSHRLLFGVAMIVSGAGGALAGITSIGDGRKPKRNRTSTHTREVTAEAKDPSNS